MKKILFLFLVIVFAGAAVLHVKLGRKDASVAINLDNLPALVSGRNEEGGVSEPAVMPEKVKDLKAIALEIIERPIPITTAVSLSESSQRQAAAKIKELNELIRKDYNEVYQWYDLGAYRRLIGDYDGAIEAWTFGSMIRPNDYIFYQNLGDLYAFYLKNYAKGEQNFFKSIANNSVNINAYVQLATLYEYAYKEKAEEAENVLLSGIKTNPTVVTLKVNLAQYYERHGRKEEALRYFEEALGLDPNNSSIQQDIDRLKSN